MHFNLCYYGSAHAINQEMLNTLTTHLSSLFTLSIYSSNQTEGHHKL